MTAFNKLINYEYGKHSDIFESAFNQIIKSLISEKDFMSLMTILQEFDLDTYEKIDSLVNSSLKGEEYMKQRNKLVYTIYSEISYDILDIINSDKEGKGELIMDYIIKFVRTNEYFVFIYYYIQKLLIDRKNENLTIKKLIREALEVAKLEPNSINKIEDLKLVPLVALFYADRNKRYKSDNVNVRKAIGYYEYIKEFVHDDCQFVERIEKSKRFSKDVSSMVRNYIRSDKIQNLLDDN